MLAALLVPVNGSENYMLTQLFTETDLVAALVARDTRALDQLYRSYSASLLGIVSKIIKQDTVAEDILQEIFLKIWKSIDQFDPSRGRLFTWMSRLARNKAIDHLRTRGEINNLKNDDLEGLTVEINQHYQIQYNPECIGLKQLIDVLTPEQRKILDMVYFQGYTQLEVSQELDIPVGTVKTRIRVSIKVLRSFFI